MHRFELEAFTAEVSRTIKPHGILAVWMYNLLTINPQIDARIHQLYTEVLGDYWPLERATLESGYKEITFPFEELRTQD